MPGEKPSALYGLERPTKRQFRRFRRSRAGENPVSLALKIRKLLKEIPRITDKEIESQLGISRRVANRYLKILGLPKEIIETVIKIEDPEVLRVLTIHQLYKLTLLPSSNEQARHFRKVMREVTAQKKPYGRK